MSAWSGSTALCALLIAGQPVFAQTSTAGGATTAERVASDTRWASMRRHLTEGWDQGHWRAALAPYAPHIRPSDEHSDVWALGLERQRTDNWLAGGSFFSNSFGQPSTYLYLGKRWPSLLGHPQLFGQFSAGVLYGYRGKYQNKVPFNYNGFSPGALASIGWQFNKNASLTVHSVGDAAVMFQFGWDYR